MRVLISPVGKRDPWGLRNGETTSPSRHGAALSTALFFQPDVVFLLPTQDRLDVGGEHTMREAEATASALRELLPAARVYIRPYDLKDPSDYAQVFAETERLASAILNEVGAAADLAIAVNISSGTPQMQSSWQLAIAAGRLNAVALQSLDPRFLAGGQPQVREVPARFWSEALAEQRARRLFKERQYESCAVEVGLLLHAPLTHRRAAARHLRDLCHLYAAMDRIDYYEARAIGEALLAVVRGLRQYEGALPALEAQATLLRALPSLHPRDIKAAHAHRETPEFLADIYHNAERCYARRAYADCLARVWRMLEGVLFCWLRDRYGIEPTDVRTSPDQAMASKVIALLQKEASRRVEITLGSAMCLLAEQLPDPSYVATMRQKFQGTDRTIGKVMERLRETRNKSVVGHDGLPVVEDTGREALALAKVMLAALAPDLDLDAHPFAAGRVALVGEVFFDALRG